MIYCEYWYQSVDQSYPNSSCTCLYHGECIFGDIREELLGEGFFCPFWDIPSEKWVDAQALEEILYYGNDVLSI